MDDILARLPLPSCYFDCVRYEMAGVRAQRDCTVCRNWEDEFRRLSASGNIDSSEEQLPLARPACYLECSERAEKNERRKCEQCDQFDREEERMIQESIEQLRAKARDAEQLASTEAVVNQPLCWFECYLRQSDGRGLRCAACRDFDKTYHNFGGGVGQKRVNTNGSATTSEVLNANGERTINRRVPLYLRKGLESEKSE